MSKRKKNTNNKPKKETQHGKPSSSSHVASKTVNVINCASGTHPGMVRKNNEDCFIAEPIWNEKIVLAAAIDGLGGYEGGELAANIAKDKIITYLNESNKGERIELLKQAVTSANNAIYKASLDDERYSQMGCVITSAIIDTENRLVNMVHVGDTRLYSFRNGELKKLSHDHSFVGYREEMKDLTEEQAMNHPNRNIVDRILGQQSHHASDPDFIEANTFALESQTTFLFCSDGLTDMITSATIVEILGRDCSLDEKKEALIQAALDAGGKDNVTVVLVEYEAQEDAPKDLDTESKEHGRDPEKKKGLDPIKKNDDSETKTKCPSWQIAISLFVGLFVGFSCGYYFGLCHHNDKQPDVHPDNSIVNTTTLLPDTLEVPVVDTALMSIETDTNNNKIDDVDGTGLQ